MSAELSAEFRARLTSTLNGLEDELQKYADSLRTRIDQVHEIWSSPSTVKIPMSEEVKLKAAELAMEKKAPFHRGNSMMDAVILLSTAEYSKQPEARGPIHFCTQNWRDFSGKDRRDPHPDLADLFEGRLRYTYGLDSVLKEIGASADLVREVRRAESVGKCMLCESAALIESAVCARCETPYEGALPDSEQFRVEPTAEGDTVTEYFDDVQGRDHEERLLVCEECGHDKFDLEFARLCPYHEHMSARWQEA